MIKNFKILVTGANGYIGSKVVKELLNLGQEVVATDFSDEHIDKRAKFIKANIFEQKDDWFSFFEKPDICLHLAWRDGFVHNSKRHMEDLSNHYYFICNLIDNGLKKIVSMGTMHEIGYWEGKVDNSTPCNPLSNYGIAKNALRKSLELYCQSKDITFVWLRAFYIYGNDEFGNSIFCKIRQANKEHVKLFPFTSGKNKYDFIEDVVLAKQISLATIQNEYSGIINCCSGIPVSLAEKVENYIKNNSFDIKLDYNKFPDRDYDSPIIYGDNEIISRIEKDYENSGN